MTCNIHKDTKGAVLTSKQFISNTAWSRYIAGYQCFVLRYTSQEDVDTIMKTAPVLMEMLILFRAPLIAPDPIPEPQDGSKKADCYQRTVADSSFHGYVHTRTLKRSVGRL